MKQLSAILSAVLLLCAAFSLGTLPVVAQETVTPDGFHYRINNGQATVYRYSGESTVLTIPASIDGCPVTSIGDHAFASCAALTSVTIPDSVIHIGDEVFCGSTNLSDVTLSKNITEIPDAAFYKCTSLNRIVIPEKVTVIKRWAFEYCTALRIVDLPAGITKIEEDAFKNCSSLEKIRYRGTRDDRDSIVLAGSHWELLNYATWYYAYGVTTTTATTTTAATTTTTRHPVATTATTIATITTPSATAPTTHSTEGTFPSDTSLTYADHPTDNSPANPNNGIWLGIAIGIGGTLLVVGIAILVMYYLRDKKYR